jgi:hypothetical protein
MKQQKAKTSAVRRADLLNQAALNRLTLDNMEIQEIDYSDYPPPGQADNSEMEDNKDYYKH